ncbi:hypothetical protein L9Z17_05280 [Leptospira noguchii]|nr:hypothetical protein [Leptospira noguchii]
MILILPGAVKNRIFSSLDGNSLFKFSAKSSGFIIYSLDLESLETLSEALILVNLSLCCCYSIFIV